MNIRTLRTDAASRLDGRLPEAWEAIAFPVGVWAFFRVLIACGGFVAGQYGVGIFGVSETAWLLFKVACRVLMFFVCSAAVLSMSRWYCSTRLGNGCSSSPLGRLNGAPLGKWLILRLLTLVLRGVPLLVGSACFAAAYSLCRRALDIYTGNGAYLMLALCLAVLGVCMLLYSLYISVLFLLCPFYIILLPDSGLFAILRMSCTAMRGGFGRVAKLSAGALRSPLMFFPLLTMMLTEYAVYCCNYCHRNVTD